MHCFTKENPEERGLLNDWVKWWEAHTIDVADSQIDPPGSHTPYSKREDKIGQQEEHSNSVIESTINSHVSADMSFADQTYTNTNPNATTNTSTSR